MTMSSFRVGMLVVCVDDGGFPSHAQRCALPVKGRIYTIRGIDPLDPELLSVFVEEIVNPHRFYSQGFKEPSFHHRRFRPAKRTSIEIFRKLVAPIDGERVS